MVYFIMPHILQHLAHLEGEAEEEEINFNWRLERRRMRDSHDPFHAPRTLFVQNFRVSKEIARALIERLTPYFPQTRVSALTPTHRVLSALKFFAGGSYQRGCVAEHNSVNMAQSSVSGSLHKVMHAMVTELAREVIKFPVTQEERSAVKLGFYQKFDIPGVIGAIDCTRISIVPPILNEEQYFCFHRCHCINVQLVCDSNLKILNVNPRHGGATHDGFVWANSTVFEYLRQLVLVHGERYTWLLGDSGYPNQPWLLTPVVGADVNTPEGRYTAAHVSARNTVERVNGVLKSKWRCTRGDRVLHYTADVARKIINCCAILHNIALTMPDYLADEEEPPIRAAALGEPQPYLNDFRAAGLAVRNELINGHFR